MKTLCGTLVSGIPRQTRLMALFLCIVVPSGHARGQIIVKDGESIAFLGDSITQEGWEREYGYVRVALQGLEAAGVKATTKPPGGPTRRDSAPTPEKRHTKGDGTRGNRPGG